MRDCRTIPVGNNEHMDPDMSTLMRTQRGDRVPPHRLLHNSGRVRQAFIVVGVGQPPVRYDVIDLGLSLPLDVDVLDHREEKNEKRCMRLRAT
jgi:hypothetical protein